MKRLIWFAAAAAAGTLALLTAQDLKLSITEGQRPAMAIPDLRGDAQAQPFMGALNETLWNDVSSAGYFKMVPKTMYPKAFPQQPGDFRQAPQPAPAPARGRRQETTVPPSGGGLWVSDWSGPPVSANYLVFGYSA